MELPAFMMPHAVTVEAYRGDAGDDDTYGPPQMVQVHQDGAVALSGGQLVSTVKLYTLLRHAALFRPESRVTLAGGGRAYVQSTAEHRDGGLGAWQHLEVVLQ